MTIRHTFQVQYTLPDETQSERCTMEMIDAIGETVAAYKGVTFIQETTEG